MRLSTSIPSYRRRRRIEWFQPEPGRAVGFAFLLVSPDLPEDPYPRHPDLKLVKRIAFAEHPEYLNVYVHQMDAANLGAAANRAAIQFVRDHAEAVVKPGDRIYTHADKPEPRTGAILIIEVPIYTLNT